MTGIGWPVAFMLVGTSFSVAVVVGSMIFFEYRGNRERYRAEVRHAELDLEHERLRNRGPGADDDDPSYVGYHEPAESDAAADDAAAVEYAVEHRPGRHEQTDGWPPRRVGDDPS